MKLTRLQLKTIVENYLLEQEDIDAALDDSSPEDSEPEGDEEKEGGGDESNVDEEEPEIPDISFKVKNKENVNINIDLRKLKTKIGSKLHSIFVNDKLRNDIDDEMDMQIIAAHGYIHPDTDKEAKDVLKKILSRDKDFKGKSDNGILAVIADKIQSRLGAQSLSLDKLSDIINKG